MKSIIFGSFNHTAKRELSKHEIRKIVSTSIGAVCGFVLLGTDESDLIITNLLTEELEDIPEKVFLGICFELIKILELSGYN